MNCHTSDPSNAIAWLSLFVSLAAVVATFITLRYQVFGMINTQLADKAREANANLNERGQMKADANHISGILSAIITARQLFNYRLKRNWIILFSIDRESFNDQFYLQLSTTIRKYLQANKFNPDNGTMPDPKTENMLRGQFASCKEFLKGSIEKDKEGGEFAKL